MVAIGALALLATPLASADEAPGVVGEVSYYKVKPGMTREFEEGRKKRNEVHRKNNDTWAWLPWEILKGDRASQYASGSFFHHWSEYGAREAFDDRDAADATMTLMPNVESVVPAQILFVPNASDPVEGIEPARFVHVTCYIVESGGVVDCGDALRLLHAAEEKAGSPPDLQWHRVFSGGDGPQWVLVRPVNKLAEFAGQGPSFEEVFCSQLGAA